MMNFEGLLKYLEETGLDKKFENLKPGDSFGVEIPVDEENNKWFRFWLSAEGNEDKIEFVTFDFEGMLRVRVCWDMEKLEDWFNNSGMLEFGKLSNDIMTETEKAEVKE